MRRFLGVGLLAIGMMSLASGKDHNDKGQNQNDQGEDQKSDKGLKKYQAPEIDPNQAVSALALLSGGILVVRRKRKPADSTNLPLS